MKKNRSASRFLIVSGAYLFLMLLACTIQPVWGIKAAVEPTTLRNVLFLPVWFGIAISAILCRKLKTSVSSNALFSVLILSVIVGFFLNLSEYNVTIVILKCISNGISILLLSFGYWFSHKNIGKFLLMIEFIFWTMKALLYYNTSPDLIISGYFLVVCWVLRAVFLQNQFKTKNQVLLSTN